MSDINAELYLYVNDENEETLSRDYFHHHYYREDENEEEHEDSDELYDDWLKDVKEKSDARTLYRTIDGLSNDDGSSPSSNLNEAVLRFSESTNIPEIARLSLSPLTQKITNCTIGDDVTTELPWKYVPKRIIDDNLFLHSDSSDFLPIKNHIERYNDDELLIGYAPTLRDDVGQFYVCLTVTSKRAMERRIDESRQEQRDKVRKAVYKEARSWEQLGSSKEVDLGIVKRRRELFEIEIKTPVEQLRSTISKKRLTDRKWSDQRDGYVELIPYRETFTNVERKLVDRATKVGAETKTNEAQTEVAMLVNAWGQCELDKEPCKKVKCCNDKKALRDLEKFVKLKTEDVCTEAHNNMTWDVYDNDYVTLGGKVTTTISNESQYVDRQTYYDGNLCRGRIINDLSWHPNLTGLAAVAYVPSQRTDNRKLSDKELYSNVLVWSFNDSLKPKLVLQSKRLVKSISFCPRNGDIIIGGCDNGHIVLWDISEKIEETENQSMDTTQVPILMKDTATSDSRYSQKDAITRIEWLSPYRKINNRGTIEDLSADTTEAELSNQFITSSEDGTVAFWELSLTPEVDAKKMEEKKKAKRIRRGEPTPDTTEIKSAYGRLYDGTYKPMYMITVTNPTTARNVPVSTVSLRYPIFKNMLVDSSGNECENGYGDDMSEMREYRVIMEKKKEETEEAEMRMKDGKKSALNRLFVGTSEGECGYVTWGGYNYSTDLAVNSEPVKWEWKKRAHDGPVSRAVRSPHTWELVLTLGGKIFALWSDDFAEPVLTRRSETGYTSCCWDPSKPSAIILGRDDGVIEIWDFFVKGHQPYATQSLSGRIITGIYPHELPMDPPCVGFCDYNGALRVLLTVKAGIDCLDVRRDWMRQFVDREVKRLEDDVVRDGAETKKVEEVKTVKEIDAVEKRKSSKMSDEAVRTITKKKIKKKPHTLIKEMHQRWIDRELDRMQREILTKKGLREDELKRRQEPVLRMKREADEKEARHRRMFENAPKLFENEVISNFPHNWEKLLATHDQFTKSDSSTTMAGEKTDERTESILTIKQEQHGDKNEDDEIMEEYQRLEAEVLEFIRSSITVTSLEHSWRKLIENGIKRRRRLLDVNMKALKTKKVNETKRSSTMRKSIIENLKITDDLIDRNVDSNNMMEKKLTNG